MDKENQELNWKLLNSSMNNKLIDKINKLLKMNKKGLSDTDILEVITL